jgi:hypothetical protein
MNPDFVLGLVGSVITLVVLFEMLRRHQLREKYAVFWVVVAVAAIVVAVFPQVLFWAAQVTGVEVPTNLLFFVASFVLLVVTVQHSYELGRLEERTRSLAEELALLRMEAERLRIEAERLPAGAAERDV